MPQVFKRLRSLLKLLINLKHKFLSYIFGRPTQDKDDDSDGFCSHTLNFTVLVLLSELEPHFSFRPTTPPLIPPIDTPPQKCKKKALLIGVENSTERPLKGPHNDVRTMRQFLIGEFKSSRKKIRTFIDHFTCRLQRL